MQWIRPKLDVFSILRQQFGPVLSIFYLCNKIYGSWKRSFCHKKSSLLRQSSWAVEQAEILPWFTVSPSHVRWLIWSYSRNLDFSRTENATLAIQRYLCWNVLGKLGVQMSWLGIRIRVVGKLWLNLSLFCSVSKHWPYVGLILQCFD